MLWGRRRRRSTATAAAVITAALLLTGCSVHVDAGTAGAARAERELSQLDGVVSVRGSGTNNLPFAGTVSVFVTAKDGLPDGRLQRLTDQVGRWVVEHSGPGTTYRGHLEVDGFGFSLGRTASENERILTVLQPLRRGDRWLGGDLRSDGPDGTDPAQIDLAVRTPADLLAGWEAVQRAGAASGWKDVTVSANAWNTPPTDTDRLRDADLSISDGTAGEDHAVGDPAAEVAAYEQVTARHTVTGASVSPGRIHLHLADLADVADATAVIARTAPDADAVLDGGVVTKDATGSDGSPPEGDDYAAADRLAAVVADRPDVTAVSLKPDWVVVTAAGPGSVVPVAEALAAAASASSVTSIDVGSDEEAAGGDVGAGLLVKGTPSSLAASAQVGARLQGYLPASASLFPTNRTVTATVGSVEEVPALVQGVEGLLPDGTVVTIGLRGRYADDAAHLTVHGGTLTVDPRSGGRTGSATADALGEAAHDAWNG
jgi:hypothetical protein